MLRELCALPCLLLSLSLNAPAVVSLGPEPVTVFTNYDQPADVRLQAETYNGRTRFQIGEIIRLKLSFTSSALKKYQINMAEYDRSGRMNYENFLLEPQGGWGDPLRSYFAYGGFMMGGLTSFRFLSPEPMVIYFDLNEWVRFDRPGKYSLRVASHRVGDLPRADAEPSTELLSNQLQLTILPAARSWQQETLKKAVATLNGPRSNDRIASAAGQMNESQNALKTLRYLGTVEAAKELAGRLLGEDSQVDFECMFGLVGSPYHDEAISEMRRRLADPDHPISSMFMQTLTSLMRNPDRTAELIAEDEKELREITQGELLKVVSQKRGKALALTLNTVLEFSSYQAGKSQSISEQTTAQIAALFDQLPIEKQMQMLESKWDMIKSPNFLPVLRKCAQQYREFPIPNEVNAYNSLHLSGAALRRWYELEPGEARAVVIKEIIRPRPRYSSQVLGILPDKTLAEAEQAMAEHFAAEDISYGAENLASLLHRYATDAVLPQVVPVVDKHVGKWACAIQAPILAYLLRVNPSLARPRLEAAIAARGNGFSACNHSLLMEVGALQPDPLLEEIALSSLDDDDTEVAVNAAAFLGRYGSSAVEETLWEHLTNWSERWRGKEESLRYLPGETNPNLWQRNLGTTLVQALATAKSWLTDQGKLHKLRQLALGPDTQQVEGLLAGWEKKPWTISYYRAGDHIHFRVLQYEIDSLKAFEEKLAQFPVGSSFTLDSSGGSATEEERSISNELAEFLTNHGMKLTLSTN